MGVLPEGRLSAATAEAAVALTPKLNASIAKACLDLTKNLVSAVQNAVIFPHRYYPALVPRRGGHGPAEASRCASQQYVSRAIAECDKAADSAMVERYGVLLDAGEVGIGQPDRQGYRTRCPGLNVFRSSLSTRTTARPWASVIFGSFLRFAHILAAWKDVPSCSAIAEYVN
jgi:hypothetical protein